MVAPAAPNPVLADTSAVIDLWRNRRSQHRNSDLLDKLGEFSAIPYQVVFEFARGAYFRSVETKVITNFLAQFSMIPTTESQIFLAAKIDGTLRAKGITVGEADILIAAAALEFNLPVVTANVKDFARIPDVEIIEYTILP